MEFGSEVVLLYGKEVLAAAKDAAGVEVVNISAALGNLFIDHIHAVQEEILNKVSMTSHSLRRCKLPSNCRPLIEVS